MTCGSPKHRREELLRLARDNKEHDISVEHTHTEPELRKSIEKKKKLEAVQ